MIIGPPSDARRWVINANAIRERIVDGRYPAGEWLPPLARINDDLNAARDYRAVQQALNELCTLKYITFVDGVGYYPGDIEPAAPPEGDLRRFIVSKPRGIPRPGDRAQFLDSEEYVTVTEFASYLRVSRMAVYRVIEANEIVGVLRIGTKMLRIPISGAEAYLSRCVVDGSQLSLEDFSDDEDDTEL